MIVQTLRWVGGIDGFLDIVDQRKLPGELVRLEVRELQQLGRAIKRLAVRGAPAIGVAAAYGVVLGMQSLSGDSDLKQALGAVVKCCEYLRSLRPTAVNLSWAVDRVRRRAEEFAAAQPEAGLPAMREVILDEAKAIYQQDVEMCRRIGENGQKFVQEGAGILTHCNAGALATAGQGTALSIIYEAHKRGRKFRVYVDETRPLLQGARLTAWELQQAGIDVTVICDSTAGWLMKQGRISAVITGADRIAANGDAANKIGTYSLSILARQHNIPFYIAAPSSTFDLSVKSGDMIPIEQRQGGEITRIGQIRIAPDGIKVYNPSFDVTEAGQITAIISEKGIIEQPNAEKIARHLG